MIGIIVFGHTEIVAGEIIGAPGGADNTVKVPKFEISGKPLVGQINTQRYLYPFKAEVAPVIVNVALFTPE